MIDFEGLYQASNLGWVRSLDRIVRHRLGVTQLRKGRILRFVPSGPNRSYLAVSLSKDGVVTKVLVHRLVAAAWIGPCPDGQEVCHGPNGQRDNSVSNLSYGTRSDNKLDKRRDGTHGGRPIRRSDGVDFINMHVAAEETGCNDGNICAVCKGRRKTAAVTAGPTADKFI